MPQVFRIHEFALEETRDEIRVSVRCSCEPYGSSLMQVFARCFPEASVHAGRKTIAALFENRGEFVFSGELPSTGELIRTLDIMKEALTVRDAADVSHCLDLYKLPDDDIPPDDWPYTDVGHLMYRAKYWHNRPSAVKIGNRLIDLIRRHPAISRAQVVCAMPTSGSGKHFDSPRLWSHTIASQLGIHSVDLVRTRPVVQQKAIGSFEERARNQLASMECDDLGGATALVVDDLYMSGETMKEAVRALCIAGAADVFALCAVKTATGTQGGVHGLMPLTPESGSS